VHAVASELLSPLPTTHLVCKPRSEGSDLIRRRWPAAPAWWRPWSRGTGASWQIRRSCTAELVRLVGIYVELLTHLHHRRLILQAWRAKPSAVKLEV